MITLYGVAISNYYCTARAALVEKNLPFAEVAVMPSADPAILAASPMGKVPYIEVGGATLSETNVIFDYLEDVQPRPALYPAGAWARAKTKEIIRTVELYVDAPARRHLPAVYFGQPVDPAAYDEVRPALEKGLRAFARLAHFRPCVAGEQFTFADITAYFQLRFANMHTMKIYAWDICDNVPGLAGYLETIGRRPSIHAADQDMQRGFARLSARR